MTTPFDTTRLDEECERIAVDVQRCYLTPVSAGEVKSVLLGQGKHLDWCFEGWLLFSTLAFDRCRRPKVVPA